MLSQILGFFLFFVFFLPALGKMIWLRNLCGSAPPTPTHQLWGVKHLMLFPHPGTERRSWFSHLLLWCARSIPWVTAALAMAQSRELYTNCLLFSASSDSPALLVLLSSGVPQHKLDLLDLGSNMGRTGNQRPLVCGGNIRNREVG